MKNHWFKFYGEEYLSDPKMLSLSACERSCWMTLLCYASMSGSNGTIRYLNESQLMAQAGVNVEKDEWSNTKGVLDKLQQLGMIRQSNGEIDILNWRKRQESYLTSAERQARFRNRKKSNAEITEVSDDSNAREEKRREEKKEYMSGFETFWKEYPRKENKKKAEQAWVKHFKGGKDRELLAKILRGLRSAVSSDQWKKDGGRFIPHPTTWLNGERWQDEVKRSDKKTNKYDNISTTTVRE